MASYVSYMCIAVSRLSNHPNLTVILAILLENPESWPICDRDRKNPDFDISSVIFKWILMILIKEHLTEYILNWNCYAENFKKLHTKYKIRLSTWTRNNTNMHVNKHETDNQFSKHFRQKLSSQNTRNDTPSDWATLRFQKFLGEHAPTTPLQFGPLVLARFISDWKISQFYLLQRLDSLSFLFTLCLTQWTVL